MEGQNWFVGGFLGCSIGRRRLNKKKKKKKKLLRLGFVDGDEEGLIVRALERPLTVFSHTTSHREVLGAERRTIAVFLYPIRRKILFYAVPLFLTQHI